MKRNLSDMKNSNKYGKAFPNKICNTLKMTRDMQDRISLYISNCIENLKHWSQIFCLFSALFCPPEADKLLKMQPAVSSIPATIYNETSPVRTWEI